MEFVPEQEVLVECVLKLEGLSDPAKVRIRRIEVEDSVPIHTNNSSKVVKAKVEYEVAVVAKRAVLAIKVPFLHSEVVYRLGKIVRLFDKEVQFYRTIEPRLRKLLHAEVTPLLLAVDERQVLFMEDMSVHGYRVQLEGRLDGEHSAITLQHLAKMHAASYVLDQEDPHYLDQLIKQQFLFGDEFIRKCYLEVGPLLGALARAQCLSPEVVRRFDMAVEKARSDIAGELDSSRFDFSVLNHGDLKAHNVLFKHDERGRPVQCRLIDFQICFWSSPALDIIFFAIQSVKRQVFASSFDGLLQSYVSTLNSTLEQLNCDVRLTEAQLKRDLDNVKTFKICSFLFRTMIDIREFRKEFVYGETAIASPELLDKLAQSVEIQESVRFWLGEFEKSGVF